MSVKVNSWWVNVYFIYFVLLFFVCLFFFCGGTLFFCFFEGWKQMIVINMKMLYFNSNCWSGEGKRFWWGEAGLMGGLLNEYRSLDQKVVIYEKTKNIIMVTTVMMMMTMMSAVWSRECVISGSLWGSSLSFNKHMHWIAVFQHTYSSVVINASKVDVVNLQKWIKQEKLAKLRQSKDTHFCFHIFNWRERKKKENNIQHDSKPSKCNQRRHSMSTERIQKYQKFIEEKILKNISVDGGSPVGKDIKKRHLLWTT